MQQDPLYTYINSSKRNRGEVMVIFYSFYKTNSYVIALGMLFMIYFVINIRNAKKIKKNIS